MVLAKEKEDQDKRELNEKRKLRKFGFELKKA